MTLPNLETALEVERDHKHLTEQMARFKLFVKSEPEPEHYSRWRLEFLWQLRDFKNRLLKHFDLEEEGGFMEDVMVMAPHCARQIKELKKEHERIPVLMDGILAELKAMTKMDSDKLARIQSRISEVMGTLREHENQEHKLIQNAYYSEYGGPA